MKKLCNSVLLLLVFLLFSSCAPVQGGSMDGTEDSSVSSEVVATLPSTDDSNDEPADYISVPAPITVPAEYRLWDAGDWEVVPSQTFEWECDWENRLEWFNGKGLSPDFLWKYLCYNHCLGGVSGGYEALPRQALSGGTYVYASSSAGVNVVTPTVADLGEWFFPGVYKDVVKSFVCPSGGRVRLSSVLEMISPPEDGLSFSVYLENQLVFPSDGSRGALLTEMGEQSYDVEIDVKKNQRIFIHIGRIGNRSASGVRMSNTVEYLTVNDEIARFSEFCTHEIGAWETVFPATLKTGGLQSRGCENCPLMQFLEIPRLPQSQCPGCSDPKFNVVQKPSLFYPGREDWNCEDCGRSKTRRIPCSETDEATGVTVYPINGAVSVGTSLRVTALSDGYEVALMKDGSYLNPYQGDLKVEIPMTPGMCPEAVRYVASDGTEHSVLFSASGGVITVEIPDSGRIVLVYEE